MTDVTTGEETDVPEPDAAENESAEPLVEDKPDQKKSARLQVSISLRSLMITVVIVALVGAVGVLAWLYVGAQRKLDAVTRQSENNAHAEKVALDYAVS